VSLWEERDLLVLRALATTEDDNLRHGFLHMARGHGAEALQLDLSVDAIHDAILTLRDVGYVEANESYSSGGGVSFTGLRVTGRGQQALGEWPLFEQFVSPETVARFLEVMALEAESEEVESNLRRAAAYIRGLGVVTLKALAVNATAHAARQALGLP
jgi:hypothetical protein